MNTVYVAARFSKYREQTNKLFKLLESNGYEIAFDWTTHGNAKLPYRNPKNIPFNEKIVDKELAACRRSDIFIFISDTGMRGTYVEMGAFLSNAFQGQRPRKMYIVGGENETHLFESVSFAHFLELHELKKIITQRKL